MAQPVRRRRRPLSLTDPQFQALDVALAEILEIQDDLTPRDLQRLREVHRKVQDELAWRDLPAVDVVMVGRDPLTGLPREVVGPIRRVRRR
jgi:hypothetical protein